MHSTSIKLSSQASFLKTHFLETSKRIQQHSGRYSQKQKKNPKSQLLTTPFLMVMQVMFRVTAPLNSKPLRATKVQLPGTDAYFPLLAYIMPEHVPTWLFHYLAAGVCTKHSFSLCALPLTTSIRDDTSRFSSSRGSFFFYMFLGVLLLSYVIYLYYMNN